MELKRRSTFRRWAPDIGENRDLPTPGLYFELATGLGMEDIIAIRQRLSQSVEVPEEVALEQKLQALKDGVLKRWLEALGSHVRIVGGPHSIAGRPLESLEDYVRIVMDQADLGGLAMGDLRDALLSFNTFSGGDELFLQRRSGSSASTAAPSVVKEEPKTDGA